MLRLCFKLPNCLFGHIRDKSVICDNVKFVCEIHIICSNKYETCLVCNANLRLYAKGFA